MGESLQDLKAMDDGSLFEWFVEHARYAGESPKMKYWIRIPGCTMALFSEDTADLRAKFFAEVRK